MKQQTINGWRKKSRREICMNLQGAGHNQFSTLTFSNSQANLLHRMYGDLSSDGRFIDHAILSLSLSVSHSGISTKNLP